MPARIDCSETIKQKLIKESSDSDYSLIDLTDNTDSDEIKWVELHQMFDR